MDWLRKSAGSLSDGVLSAKPPLTYILYRAKGGHKLVNQKSSVFITESFIIFRSSLESSILVDSNQELSNVVRSPLKSSEVVISNSVL